MLAAPSVEHALKALEHLPTTHRGIVLVPPEATQRGEADRGVREHESIDALGMQGSEELPHQPPFRETEDVRSLDPLGVHDGHDVVDPLLEGRCPIEAIGAGHAALVELEHADVPTEVLARAAVHLVLPGEFDVGDHSRDDDQVRARTPALIGDVEVAAART